MSSSEKYPLLKISLSDLSKELVHHIELVWTRDWSQYPLRIGVHFNYQDIKELPSFETTIAELRKIPSICEKYSEASLEKPILIFLELIVSFIPNPTHVDKAFEHWWGPFTDFIETLNVPIHLYIGLSNFQSDQDEYRFNSETAICFFENSSLEGVLNNTEHMTLSDLYPEPGQSLHTIPGAIKVEFPLPASRNFIEYGHYSRKCIERMMPLKDALCLSIFGRVVIGPWIPICNPAFPVDGVRPIGFPEDRERFYEPKSHLDNKSWKRFVRLYPHLKKLYEDNEADLEEGRGVRRRFIATINRFEKTFKDGYWDSVVVDLVIIMESLLTPNKLGGRMQIALAASNLLGTKEEEAKELFENITNMYKLRNATVHGEPSTTESWEGQILQIARVAGSTANKLSDGVREYTFEVMRDYARRSIAAMIILYYETGLSPSGAVTQKLHRLHLNIECREKLQSEAGCYPLASRPAPPDSFFGQTF
jgi:hypothetical protein